MLPAKLAGAVFPLASPPTLKRASYRSFVAPVGDVYKGFKLFYKNDRRDGSRLMTPEEVLQLTPAPIYIQYQ